MEDLLQKLKDSELKNTKLSLENQALKAAMQTQIHQRKTDHDPEVNALQDQLRSGQAEKETCLQKIFELEILVKAVEEKWLNVQGDVKRNVELMEKLKIWQGQLHYSQTYWYIKVNNLKNHLRSEQVEKENCLQKIKELKSLVEATEKKLLNVQEDSQIKAQKMEEDMKFLNVKTIMFQELALMSDSDKARRRKDERKAQKEEEKRLKKELKEKMEQEKREKKQREKEAKKEKRKTASHLPSAC